MSNCLRALFPRQAQQADGISLLPTQSQAQGRQVDEGTADSARARGCCNPQSGSPRDACMEFFVKPVLYFGSLLGVCYLNTFVASIIFDYTKKEANACLVVNIIVIFAIGLPIGAQTCLKGCFTSSRHPH